MRRLNPVAKHVLTAQSTRSPCTHVMAKRWQNGALIPSFLLPRKKKKRQQQMRQGQCWKGRIGEEARRKHTQNQPPSFWVFPRFTVSVSLTVSGAEKLTNSINSFPPLGLPPPRCAPQIAPHPHTCLTFRFWHTEHISSQAFSRLLVKA